MYFFCFQFLRLSFAAQRYNKLLNYATLKCRFLRKVEKMRHFFTQSRFLGRNITFYVSNFLLLYNFSTKVPLKFRMAKGHKKRRPFGRRFWLLAKMVYFHSSSVNLPSASYLCRKLIGLCSKRISTVACLLLIAISILLLKPNVPCLSETAAPAALIATLK